MSMKAYPQVPVGPLLEWCHRHRTINDPQTDSQLSPVGACARRFGIDPGQVHRWNRRGHLPIWTADRLACAAGVHPTAIWGGGSGFVKTADVDAPEVVVAAQPWKSNAELIVTCARLGYIGHRVLDPTYGRGTWWKLHSPAKLVTHDIGLDGVDFRALPDEGLFDTVAFDPPYIPQGGRTSSTLTADANGATFLDRYGLRSGPRTNTELRELVRAGLAEFTRVLRPGGTLIVKCMPYVNGGAFRPMPRWIAEDAEQLGYRHIDELIHLRRPGPQPAHARQLTARRNYSILQVFRLTATAHRPPQLDLIGAD